MLISRLILLVTVFVTACSAPVRAVTDYVQFKHSTKQSVVAQTKLNPAFQYLFITIKGKSFFMARGAVESSPNGPVDVWYSGSREVLRTQNGRIVSAGGTPIEWSDVALSSQPAWSNIKGATTIERRRDVMPGYHFGLRDTLVVSPIKAPTNSQFYGPIPSDLHWFSEVSSGPYPLPASRYAVRFDGDRTEVIYSEQCLSNDECFSWQRWPTRS